jgi:hypothetical protein
MKQLGANFYETIALYKAGEVPEALFCRIGYVICGSSIPTTLMNLRLDTEDKESYEYLYGGHFWLVETFKDLESIKTRHVDSDGFYMSILKAADAFDMCEYVSDNPAFVGIFNVTNNSGGDTYYIPQNLVTANIVHSIELTRQAWRPLHDMDSTEGKVL